MSEGLLELLMAADVEGFNAQRGERSRPELFAAELAELNLRGVDLSGANLDKADLTGTDLSDANLTRASIAGADATGAKLVGVAGLKARLAGAWLDGADLTNADLTRADLSAAVLSKSLATGACLSGARLKGADARGVRWAGVDMSEAHLAKARFEGADLSGAKLGGAVGPEADLRRARLDGVSARDARFPDANFREASLVGASLVGANLTGADFSGADLTNADLARANLTNAKLTGAKLRGASLSDATLDGASLVGVDLAGVDLTGLDSAALGLSGDQVASVAAVGVVADATAPIEVRSPCAARGPEGVLVVWENVERLEEVPAVEEDLEPPPPRRHGTVRVVLITPVGPLGVGAVLPVSLDGVVSSGVIAWAGGFQVVLFRQRAGGFAATRVLVDGQGQPGAAATSVVAHEPVGNAVLVPIGSELGVFSLARRGPAVALFRKVEAGLAAVRSDNMPTAQRFASRHHPIVACKGGVVVPTDGRGPGRPLRAPPGFPGLAGSVVPLGEQWLAVWATGAAGRESPAIRLAPLALRGAPDVSVLTRTSALRALDVVGGAAAAIAWLDGDQPRTAYGDEPTPVDCGAPIPGAREIVLAPAAPGHPPAVVVVAGDGSVVVRALDGAALGRWAPAQV